MLAGVNPKHIPSLIMSAGIVALLCWFFWPRDAVEPVSPMADGQAQEATNLAPPLAENDAPFEPQPFSAADPAAVQAALAALVAAQEQEMAEQARIDKTVLNNLRQIAQGAEQYFLEAGVSSVTSVALVGTNSSQYVKRFATVAGEAYPEVIFQGYPVISTGVAGVRDVSFEGSNRARNFPVSP
jgi:type IV pilus assembly protein PilA